MKRVVVAGAGIFGLCTAWACVRRGMQVVVHEAGPIPNPAASSADHHRLIRYPYGPLTGYARLIPAAFELWEKVWRDIGERLYVETGSLALGSRSTGWIEASLPVLEELGVAFDQLTADEVMTRYPELSIPESVRGLHTPTGGVLLAHEIVTALVEHLSARGVEFRAQSLYDLESGRADESVVLAVGAWSPHVRATRQLCAFPERPPAWMQAASGCPMILDLDVESGLYLVPAVGDYPAKFGNHLPGATVTLDPGRSDPPAAHHTEIRELHRIYNARIRGVVPDATYRVCHYAMAEERRFFLQPVPGHLHALRIGGGSGHGFKFGPMVGEMAARVLAEEYPLPDAARVIAGKAPYLR